MNEIFISRIDDEKRRRVFEGATKVFLAYGYNRTTLDDIAKAAEMSRPALYLLFRNKSDIYRAIAQTFFDAGAADAERALAGGGSFVERVTGMIDCGIVAHVAEIMASPHGEEILRAKDSLAGDIAQKGRQTMQAMLARTIAAEAAARGVDLDDELSAPVLAGIFFDAIDGLKEREFEPGALRSQARALALLMDRAIGG